MLPWVHTAHAATGQQCVHVSLMSQGMLAVAKMDSLDDGQRV